MISKAERHQFLDGYLNEAVLMGVPGANEDNGHGHAFPDANREDLSWEALKVLVRGALRFLAMPETIPWLRVAERQLSGLGPIGKRSAMANAGAAFWNARQDHSGPALNFRWFLCSTGGGQMPQDYAGQVLDGLAAKCHPEYLRFNNDNGKIEIDD